MCGRNTIPIQTGDAWYPGDALFAWSSIADTDTLEINPSLGSTVPKVAGGAVITGGLWDMDASAYSGNSMTQNLLPTKPILLAAVLDIDNHTAAYKNAIISAGGGTNVSIQVGPSVATGMRAIMAASNGSVTLTFPPSQAGAHVFWFYSDGINSCICGLDQTTVAPITTLDLTKANAMSKFIGIGTAVSTPASNMKHGSVLILNRDGLTLADAKALVAKMQQLHSIA